MKLTFTKAEETMVLSNLSALAEIATEVEGEEVTFNREGIEKELNTNSTYAFRNKANELTVAIDDDVTIEMLQLALRFATVIKPMIKPFAKMVKSLSSDYNDFFKNRIKYAVGTTTIRYNGIDIEAVVIFSMKRRNHYLDSHFEIVASNLSLGNHPNDQEFTFYDHMEVDKLILGKMPDVKFNTKDIGYDDAKKLYDEMVSERDHNNYKRKSEVSRHLR